MTLLLINGVYYPRIATALAVVAAIARPIYVMTYTGKGGPDSRIVAAAIGMHPILILSVVTMGTFIYRSVTG